MGGASDSRVNILHSRGASFGRCEIIDDPGTSWHAIIRSSIGSWS